MSTLPRYFCWTKFGAEAGESIETILERKNQERKANNGVFLWGIGNAIAPSLECLLQYTRMPEVIFSPIRSKPKKIDVNPSAIAMWKYGKTMDGKVYEIPNTSKVTSRVSNTSGKGHYALICKARDILSINGQGEVMEHSQLRNLRTGNPVGFSQVTSVVTLDENAIANGAKYIAALRVQLVYPYFIKLIDPFPVTSN